MNWGVKRLRICEPTKLLQLDNNGEWSGASLVTHTDFGLSSSTARNQPARCLQDPGGEAKVSWESDKHSLDAPGWELRRGDLESS